MGALPSEVLAGIGESGYGKAAENDGGTGAIMGENAYFRNALAQFTHEAANGGAIRHLSDLGYSVKQIADRLDFPVPYEKLRNEVWERLLGTGVILQGRPGGVKEEKAVYVREYDRYGKTSFRRVVEPGEEETICWREQIVKREDAFPAEKLYSMLRAKQEENGIDNSYLSCDFGLIAQREPERYHAMLQALEEKQREYITGLPWGNKRFYHRLDSSMMNILMCLYGEALYQGECCFRKTGDVLVLTE